MPKDWEKAWLSNDVFKDIPEVNIFPNITVFNRKIYTFSENEVFIKFTRISAGIRSYDELAYLDTNSCIHRVSPSEYIVVLKFPDTQKITVLGVLNDRYIKISDLDSYNAEIKLPPEGWTVVPMSEAWDSDQLEMESLVHCAERRVRTFFPKFIKQTRMGSNLRAERGLKQPD